MDGVVGLSLALNAQDSGLDPAPSREEDFNKINESQSPHVGMMCMGSVEYRLRCTLQLNIARHIVVDNVRNEVSVSTEFESYVGKGADFSTPIGRSS
ncbi:hypothetical protein TNCV_1847671 [Trichonephila clavipes]|nr:hypothetical protein TNCV_1847671 [Trichonephila clavipes]